ncbi:MAG: lytic transglycosylase domain-containing protein [Gammaproteobacteria bacterium]|jgi:soluble lytic murein transglycosylase-like protein
MSPLRVQVALALMSLLLLPAQYVMAARYFIYQTPDGSRLISDHPMNNPTYKLITSRSKLKGTGRIAATRIRYHTPPQVKQWDDLIGLLARRHHVDVALVKAVIHTESYFNYRAVSNAGAEGLMQLMPKTAARYGVNDPKNPYENLDAGIKYLHDLLVKYHRNVRYALAAYNAGEKAVHYYNGVPPYKETRAYVRKVLAYREYYERVN